jgi:hypothetical protein
MTLHAHRFREDAHRHGSPVHKDTGGQDWFNSAVACLDRAVQHCLALQRGNGSWEVLPDGRIFETALCGYALSHTPGALHREAVTRAQRWVASATPQAHSPVTHLLEDVLRRIVLGEGGRST